jgi:pentatricopeptide repeat protein
MLMEKCVNDVSIAQLLSYFSGKDDLLLCRELWAQMIDQGISPGPISRALFLRYDLLN